MSLFKPSNAYHAPMSQLWTHSDEDIEKWAVDPNCIEREQCAAFLVERRALEEKRQAQEVEARATKRAELQDNPFDPRSEVSADAKHVAGRIVTHLWIIFVLLPVVLAVLWSLMK